MPFDARSLAAESADNYPPFPFIGLDGETYELPHPMALSTGAAQRFNDAWKSGEEAKAFELLREWAPDAADAIAEMPVHVTQQLFAAWTDLVTESGKERSESSTPNRTARRSKRTSRSGASGSGI